MELKGNRKLSRAGDAKVPKALSELEAGINKQVISSSSGESPNHLSRASSTSSCSNDSASRLRILSSANPPLAATQLESRARHCGLLAGLNFPVITLKGTEDSLCSLLPKGYSAASAMLYGKVGTGGTRPCGERPLASTCHIVLHTAQDHPSGCCAGAHEGSRQCL